jgi:hypothetical protein
MRNVAANPNFEINKFAAAMDEAMRALRIT